MSKRVAAQQAKEFSLNNDEEKSGCTVNVQMVVYSWYTKQKAHGTFNVTLFFQK